VSLATLADPLRIADINPEGRAAISDAAYDDGTPLVLDDPQGWMVAEQTADRLVLLRPMDVDSQDPLIDRDHEVVGIGRVDDESLSSDWMVMSHGSCALTLDLDGLTVPSIRLDPASRPNPSDTELHLLVTEPSCNSGQNAKGRVEIVAVDESEDAIALIIGIRPKTGWADCPSNPATRVTVSLEAPLGDRVIFNATLAQPVPLTFPAG
jgi:hypothetical protein